MVKKFRVVINTKNHKPLIWNKQLLFFDLLEFDITGVKLSSPTHPSIFHSTHPSPYKKTKLDFKKSDYPGKIDNSIFVHSKNNLEKQMDPKEVVKHFPLGVPFIVTLNSVMYIADTLFDSTFSITNFETNNQLTLKQNFSPLAEAI